MKNLDVHFSDSELTTLIRIRKLFFLFTSFFILLSIVFGVLYKYSHIAGLAPFIPFIIALILIISIFCLSKYNKAVINTSYCLIANNLGWEIHNGAAGWKLMYNLYQNCLKNFGLLHGKGHVQFNNSLQGEIENYKFTLDNISWIEPESTKHGEKDTTVAEYNLLTIDTPCPINCNILIKKNSMLKWGIKNLSRMKIENDEFEKYYDVYTDNPEMALGVLSVDFLGSLLDYNQIYKKLIEIIITPTKIFLYQNDGPWNKMFSHNIFLSPRIHCQKEIEKINIELNALSILDSLKNQ
ncbi:MAG: DUF3137 domain-containing protein [Elusimicrobiaceae bacterium]|nr:DUF3137 domain-containing protein [Elusimicrobiaceae bacterium]